MSISSLLRNSISFCLASIILMFVTGCRHHSEDGSLETSSKHTLLIYMVGDNNLTNVVDPNIAACIEALQNTTNPLNLVIYRDNRSSKNGKPQLYQVVLSEDQQTAENRYLKQWDTDIDSTDPAILEEVVKLTFDTFKSEIKGICFWSHGGSWIPGFDYGLASSLSSPSRAPQFFGIDQERYMEIWELREALQASGHHMDYLLFDACHMGTVEVCYELRKCCDWIVAAESELATAGLMYSQLIRCLSKVKEHNSGDNTFEDKLRSTLRDVVKTSENSKQEGTLALYKTAGAGMENLHTAFVNLRKQHPEILVQMAENVQDWHNQLQSYGRTISGSLYYYYNTAEYGEILQGSLQSQIEEVVDYAYNHGGWYGDPFTKDFVTDCGIACSIPEFFSIDSRSRLLEEAYRRIQWSEGIVP